jgi:PAS domain S-box-containing protein
MQNPINEQDFYHRIVERSEDGIWIINEKSETTFVNKKMTEILGYSLEEMLSKDMFYFMDEEFKPIAKRNMERRAAGIHENHDFLFRKKNGKKVWTSIAASPINDSSGKFIGALGMISDITQRRKSEIILTAQKNIFKLLNIGEPLEATLAELTNAIDFIMDDVQSSILLLDDRGKYLLKGAAPKIPEAYSNAIHGAPIGPKHGSCGTSAFEKKLIIVSDIMNDPLWEDYREVAKPFGFRACWSSPIFSTKDNRVIGTFATYFKTIRSPDHEEMQLIKEITDAASRVQMIKSDFSICGGNCLVGRYIENFFQNLPNFQVVLNN